MNNAAGPWHKIDYDKPETLPPLDKKVLVLKKVFADTKENKCPYFIEGVDTLVGKFCSTPLWSGIKQNVQTHNSPCLDLWLYQYERKRWDYWAEIHLPGEGE